MLDHEHQTSKHKKSHKKTILPVVNSRYLPNDKTGADSSWRVMVAHQSVENHGRSNRQPGITQTHFGVCRSDIFLPRKEMDKLEKYLHICSIIFWQKYLICLSCNNLFKRFVDDSVSYLGNFVFFRFADNLFQENKTLHLPRTFCTESQKWQRNWKVLMPHYYQASKSM